MPRHKFSGMFLDRFGNKLTYALSIFFWSTFTLLQSFALGLKSLLLLRLGLGISEAPCFPVNSRVVSKWFPQHERARATATYTVGEYIGLAAFSPLLFLCWNIMVGEYYFLLPVR